MVVPDPALPDLSGTVTVVTGAGGGIGGGIVARFAAAGAAVVVHHRASAERAAAVVAEVQRGGGRAVAAQADITDPDECAALMRLAVERFGRLDAVAAAGVQPVADLPAVSLDQWRAVVETNLTGTFVAVQAAAATMRGGSITLVASIEAGRPARAHAHYAASKAGVVGFARGDALEYASVGIRVNTVSAGLIRREGLESEWPEGVEWWRRSAPLARLGEPEDVGDACVFLASPMARWITGHDLVVDGGVSVGPGW